MSKSWPDATCAGIPGEQHFFFGSSHEPLFGVLHQPSKVTELEPCGIVLCSPFAHEHGFAHRMLVEWARALARIGVYVLRFDYRGHGDSAGSFEQYTVTDWLDDVQSAMAELERRSGAACRGLCGLRLGATLAALAAARDSRDLLLLLWEPIVRGDQYLDELLRIVLAKDLASGSGTRRTRSELHASLAQGGEVTVEGHVFTEALCRTLSSIDLLETRPCQPRPVLIAQISKRKPDVNGKGLEALVRAYAQDQDSSLCSVCAPPLWYGPLVGPYNSRIQPTALFDQSLAWLRARLGESGETAAPAASAAAPNCVETEAAPLSSAAARAIKHAVDPLAPESNESVVSFTVEEVPVAGILQLPRSDAQHRPVIILLPQGMNRRTGWNRLYVRLARTLARHGWPTLRFDARGLGDSAGGLDMVTGAELFYAIETGLHANEASAAIDFVWQTLGPRPVILAGACGGAITASLLAARDERVVGAALFETPLLYSTRNRTAQPMWRYRDALRSADAWWRILTFRVDYRNHLRSLRAALARRFSSPARRPPNQWLIDALGPRVNLEFISSFGLNIKHRLPLLYVLGSTDNARCFLRIRPPLLAASEETQHCLSQCDVPGADHDFLEPEHASQLTTIFSNWLSNSSQPWARPCAHDPRRA